MTDYLVSELKKLSTININQVHTMKTILTIITASLFALTAITPATANDIAVTDTTNIETSFSQANTEKIEKAIITNLNSEVYGVVESSLFNVMEMKISYPYFKSVGVEKQLRKIITESSSQSLRFKAYLTLTYIRNQDSFDSPETLAEMLDNSDQNKIFYKLQNSVQSDQFTVSN